MAEKKNQVAKATATDKTNAGNAERYRMRKQYAEEVVPALIKRFGYKNINEVPRLEKIVLIYNICTLLPIYLNIKAFKNKIN